LGIGVWRKREAWKDYGTDPDEGVEGGGKERLK